MSRRALVRVALSPALVLSLFVSPVPAQDVPASSVGVLRDFAPSDDVAGGLAYEALRDLVNRTDDELRAARFSRPSLTARRDLVNWIDDDPRTPRGALWRAVVVPGWGQYYNRQYYKIPIVYAGLGGMAASALLVNRRYLLYRRAFLFIARRTNGEPVFPQYEQEYHRLIRELGFPPDDALSPEQVEERQRRLAPGFRQTRDNLRRNRDLLYIGIGLFYGLSILDAYVSAHLLEFDVGEDLTMALHPVPGGIAARLRIGQ